jgi:hypothetical protein
MAALLPVADNLSSQSTLTKFMSRVVHAFFLLLAPPAQSFSLSRAVKMIYATFKILNLKGLGDPNRGNGMPKLAAGSIPLFLVSLERNQQEQVLVILLQNALER